MTYATTVPAASERHWLCPDPIFEEVLAEYEARQADENVLVSALTHDEMGRRRDEFLVSVGRATGVLLNVLVREAKARSILEIGTGLGYSTMWLADAARANGGRVLTVDTVVDKQAHARSALQRAGLLDRVELHHGDALDLLRTTEGRFDFVLLDLWKDLYIACIDAVLPRLQAGATIVADNMLKPPSARMAAARYQTHVQANASLHTVLLHVGSGLAVSRYGL